MAQLARYVIFRGNDPLTPPQSKLIWHKGDWGLPSATLKWRYYHKEIVLTINGPEGDEVKKAFEEAAGSAAVKAAIAGLIAGYLTGGTTAIQAAAATFVADLDNVIEKSLQKVVDITYELQDSGGWGDYQ